MMVPLKGCPTHLPAAVQVELSGAAKEKFTALDGDSLSVEARREGTTAIALARVRLARRG